MSISYKEEFKVTLNQEENKSLASKINMLSKPLKEMVLNKNIPDEIGDREFPKDDKELLLSINKARQEWILANYNFEFAADDGLVDYYIYKIKACEVKYEYLIKIAKERGLTAEVKGISTNTIL